MYLKNDFISILANNEVVAKYKNVPDFIDNSDEIKAELQEILDDDGHLPDYLRYFELNGSSNVIEIADYLEKCYRKFKIEFFSKNNDTNKAFNNELIKQLVIIRNTIVQKINEIKQIKDNTIDQMLDMKLQLCDQVINFIMDTANKTEDIEQIKDLSKKKILIEQASQSRKILVRHSFKWLKGDDLLLKFFNYLKSDELISRNTEEKDFIDVFSNIPVSEIKNPVQWEKGAKLFAYFFKKLIDNRYIKQKPSWILLKYCFTYYKDDIGSYIPISADIRGSLSGSNYSHPKDKNLIDKLFVT